jgi:beta-phosphoglucomutase-like phosphatase (HAD superfamily)
VVFDFDDTLVASLEIQLKAWNDVIHQYLENGQLKDSDLSPLFKGGQDIVRVLKM